MLAAPPWPGCGWCTTAWIDLRQRVRQAWSLVDVQLQRRHDLIPDLVGHGPRATAITSSSCRASWPRCSGEGRGHAAGRGRPHYRAVSKVALAIAGGIPELKADTTFLALQKSLIDTEQRIALARGYFNDIATHYNTQLESHAGGTDGPPGSHEAGKR